MTSENKTYQVMKWISSENKFNPVGSIFLNLSRARDRAAGERLRDRASQFAVFDQHGNMVENEAGKLES